MLGILLFGVAAGLVGYVVAKAPTVVILDTSRGKVPAVKKRGDVTTDPPTVVSCPCVSFLSSGAHLGRRNGVDEIYIRPRMTSEELANLEQKDAILVSWPFTKTAPGRVIVELGADIYAYACLTTKCGKVIIQRDPATRFFDEGFSILNDMSYGRGALVTVTSIDS